MLEGNILADVRAYLDITWEDAATDAKLSGIILRGMSRLKEISSNDAVDFTVEGQPRALLFDYCRYAQSNALEVFETNYRQQLISLRIKNLLGGAERED